MSAKRYQFKLIEAADAPELETKLREAGTRMWSAVDTACYRTDAAACC